MAWTTVERHAPVRRGDLPPDRRQHHPRDAAARPRPAGLRREGRRRAGHRAAPDQGRPRRTSSRSSRRAASRRAAGAATSTPRRRRAPARSDRPSPAQPKGRSRIPGTALAVSGLFRRTSSSPSSPVVAVASATRRRCGRAPAAAARTTARPARPRERRPPTPRTSGPPRRRARAAPRRPASGERGQPGDEQRWPMLDGGRLDPAPEQHAVDRGGGDQQARGERVSSSVTT